jgi:hypothetical protein
MLMQILNKFNLKKVTKKNPSINFPNKIYIKINLFNIMKDSSFINKNHLLNSLEKINIKIIGIL